MVRTSLTHPLDVFWIDPAAHGGSGRLGLTYAPGKCGRAPVSGVDWQRDLGLDLDRLRGHHAADLLVSLMETFEYELLGIPTLFAEARARGIEVVHLPIVDTEAPATHQVPEVFELIGDVRDALAKGRTVVIHCRGGQGRTGMLAAAVLTSYGHGADAAIALVRAVQPRAVESSAQQRFVENAADRYARDQRD
ncbi:MAG TPA: cyclin-dependent kinase inhibitor 3 family protein [Trueperaceae bacterium]|nr:cyclin-dependent kinase inhibitor 3 family protein [Trueperaceae bacterium]